MEGNLELGKPRKEIDKLKKRIDKIKAGIARLGEPRPGTLSRQYNICGKPNCVCKRKRQPKRHGPYYQLSYTRGGESKTEFVRQAELPLVKKQLRDYAAFTRLKDEWIDCSLEIIKLHKLQARNNQCSNRRTLTLPP